MKGEIFREERMESGCGDPTFAVGTHQSIVGVPMSDALGISECSPFPLSPSVALHVPSSQDLAGSLGGRLCGGK